MKHERFHDDRLSPQENKAVEMLFNGMTRDEIAEEMDVYPAHVSVLFSMARRKGIDVPKLRAGAPYRGSITIERLAEIRASLMASDIPRGEILPTISKRTGITVNCLKVRFWRWDNNIQPKREGQSA